MKRLIAYYYEVYYRLIKWYWDRASKDSTINGVILMFHHISDEHLEGVLESCQHSIAEFEHVIKDYLEQGYIYVSVQEALRMIKEKNKQKFAVVTFDDIPLDAYEYGLPLLQRMQIPFTLFITTGYLNTNGYISDKQLKDIDKSLFCTIGAHTVTHPNLRRSTNSSDELKKSKEQLEKLLGHPIDYMAYPYGRPSSVSCKVMKEAKNVGYTCAFGTIQTYLNDISCKVSYYFPRIVKK